MATDKQKRELALQLHAIGQSGYAEIIRKVVGLGNRPDVFTSYALAKKSAENQTKTTGNSAFVLEFGTPYGLKPSGSTSFFDGAADSVHCFVVAATNADEAKLMQYGFHRR